MFITCSACNEWILVHTLPSELTRQLHAKAPVPERSTSPSLPLMSAVLWIFFAVFSLYEGESSCLRIHSRRIFKRVTHWMDRSPSRLYFVSSEPEPLRSPISVSVHIECAESSSAEKPNITTKAPSKARPVLNLNHDMQFRAFLPVSELELDFIQ